MCFSATWHVFCGWWRNILMPFFCFIDLESSHGLSSIIFTNLLNKTFIKFNCAVKCKQTDLKMTTFMLPTAQCANIKLIYLIHLSARDQRKPSSFVKRNNVTDWNKRVFFAINYDRKTLQVNENELMRPSHIDVKQLN